MLFVSKRTYRTVGEALLCTEGSVTWMSADCAGAKLPVKRSGISALAVAKGSGTSLFATSS